MTATGPGTGAGAGAGARTLRLGTLGFERGAHLLVRRALLDLRPGGELAVAGEDPALPVHLRAWCRAHGHELRTPDPGGDPGGQETGDVRARIVRGRADLDRWSGAERAGGPGPV
ncbi:sulfurtransferase TusA family protein, partial [Streptomyces sp. CNQ085]|nr:sulfurtransferase TusA family protein [Streptomyces sp. CNQ085]